MSVTNSQRFIFKEMGLDLMCYDSDKDEVHIFNPTARTIHRMLCEGKTEAEIAGALRSAFPDSEGKAIEVDVRACIEDLVKKGLGDR